jgi:hypothetical protein
MSEQIYKYDAEIFRISEILNNCEGNYTRVYSPMTLSKARKMLLEMAKQYEFAYFSNYDGDEDSEDYALWNRNCIYEMQDRGLIPMT